MLKEKKNNIHLQGMVSEGRFAVERVCVVVILSPIMTGF